MSTQGHKTQSTTGAAPTGTLKVWSIRGEELSIDSSSGLAFNGAAKGKSCKRKTYDSLTCKRVSDSKLLQAVEAKYNRQTKLLQRITHTPTLTGHSYTHETHTGQHM